MHTHDVVLVALLKNLADFDIAREQHWYRIPVASVDRWLKRRWPPQWLAFYHPKAFGNLAFAIHYVAWVDDIRPVQRWELFPDYPRDAKALLPYYQLLLAPLQRLPRPIVSYRRRRLVFIPTTGAKFLQASEINDLYDESTLEDRLWFEFKRRRIRAERQMLVTINKHTYMLDFAIYCAAGKINIEADGDFWHANPQRIPQDNLRNNDLGMNGWTVLRFNSKQIAEELESYCLPAIIENINTLGGVDEGYLVVRHANLDPSGPIQLSLFDRESI
jgi:very-short-patch-repair endonuclease